MGFHEEYNIKRVINASGTMTALGASRVNEKIASKMSEILPEFIEMNDLQRVASGIISQATGAEAGCVTASAASGISVSIAACMTGNDFYKIEKLPDTEGMKNQVILQKGHSVNFGAAVPQMIKLAGADLIEIGTATQCGQYQMEGAINENTAAALYVVSHHTVQSGLISLNEFSRTAKKYDIPVIVDAASEYDLKGFLNEGADIVLYSGHKFLGGPTSGIIAGKKDLVKSCFFQKKGIGRGMKVGKESILGVMEALKQWMKRDAELIKKQEDQKIEYANNYLNNFPCLETSYSPDPTGNPITRLKVKVLPDKSPLNAFELSQLLSEGDPSIKVRNHHVDQDIFFIDPCNLREGEIEIICGRIKELITNPVKKRYETQNLAELTTQNLLSYLDE